MFLNSCDWSKSEAFLKSLTSSFLLQLKTLILRLVLVSLFSTRYLRPRQEPSSFWNSGVCITAESWSEISLSISRSEEHTSELQSLMRISYAVFCLEKKKTRIREKVSNT